MLFARRVFLRLFPALATIMMASGGEARAGPGGVAEMPVQTGGGFSVPVTSIKNLRFRNTIHQQFDFSCGSAALATLLTHHYNFPVTEQQVFSEMYARGDKAKIRREGFSLLDIKMYLEAHGFAADGFVAELEQLSAAGIPAIALIKEHGYHHFVVLKGLRDGRVLIGDPSAGTRALQYDRFKEMWGNGILFVILNRHEHARFNSDADWRAAPGAPFAEGLRNGTLGAALPKRGPADF